MKGYHLVEQLARRLVRGLEVDTVVNGAQPDSGGLEGGDDLGRGHTLILKGAEDSGAPVCTGTRRATP